MAGGASKRIVGIDLGTTHTVVSWAKPVRGAVPEVFAIPQLVTPTEVDRLALLDSALYAPTAGEAPEDPWGDAPWVVGQLARRRGAEVAGRLVASAKSWLCHSGVDRLAPILPWGLSEEDDAVARISPVDASARVLSHVKRAWDQAFPSHPLAEQEVILTVPASFDEAARELTLQAARRAGLPVRLLEEPQAAFYDYMRQAGKDGLRALIDEEGDNAAGSLVLVCDVGGGTTDLSLIRVSRTKAKKSGFEVTRVAVGQHLLLGGDNMDLALAHACEARLVAPPSRLDPARFGQLVLACRRAKERLLSGDDALLDVPVTVAGPGSKLIGSTLSTRIDRQEAERLVLDGFFPSAPRDARPRRVRSALIGFGLPYEQDAAITRHVAWFFARHAADGELSPKALLLNGGVFRAQRIGQRLAEAIDSWGGPAIEILPHGDPDLAVARGAVAFGLALHGLGPRIEAGAARGYYIGLGRGSGDQAQAVCVVPRGAKEGTTHRATGRTFALVVGRAVRFELFASDDASHAAGDVVAIDDEHFEQLPPLAATLGAELVVPGKSQEIKVGIEGELTAIGTLDLACVDEQAGRRFGLAFQLRDDAPAAPRESMHPSVPAPPLSKGDPTRGKPFQESIESIDRVFGKGRQDVSPREVKDLLRELERLLGDRSGWTLQLTRALFDAIWAGHAARKRSADHERMFWLLAGYCVRPGFGDPLDAARVKAMFALFDEALSFPGETRGWRHFWITWRRVAAGLGEPEQTLIRDGIDPLIAPATRTTKKPKKIRAEALDEMLEMAACLERLPPQRRAQLGGWILERTWTDRDPRLWAALGRIGSRVPAYASVHHVVSARTAEQWLDHLLREKWEQLPTAAQAAVQLARVTGDRARDLSDSVRSEVEKKLTRCNAPSEWIRAVRELAELQDSDRSAFYGEDLPVGLKLVG
ncbi:MAG: hsp70 family protein [Deltaproteobacteria bacterium]|nr:hsp70 family protein [Deltaproteobacteria bacterium]